MLSPAVTLPSSHRRRNDGRDECLVTPPSPAAAAGAAAAGPALLPEVGDEVLEVVAVVGRFGGLLQVHLYSSNGYDACACVAHALSRLGSIGHLHHEEAFALVAAVSVGQRGEDGIVPPRGRVEHLQKSTRESLTCFKKTIGGGG